MPDLNATEIKSEDGLTVLAHSSIRQLRARWQELFRTESPHAFGPDLLRRSLAWRLQERQFGGLPYVMQRQLDNLVRQMGKRPDCRIQVPRRLRPGTVLVRTWKGRSHRLTILDDGFAFEGKTYASLSEIARRITGTRWNGPRFFGLRTNASAGASRPATGPDQRGVCGPTDTPELDLFDRDIEAGHVR